MGCIEKSSVKVYPECMPSLGLVFGSLGKHVREHDRLSLYSI